MVQNLIECIIYMFVGIGLGICFYELHKTIKEWVNE